MNQTSNKTQVSLGIKIQKIKYLKISHYFKKHLTKNIICSIISISV